ncbi:MAG: hypothetical protein CSA40_02100 [Flavobacteriales bacterium]|nr:MAG: hypothetical protein CSA40_02100 [Flavobacteriales bacterium]
MALTTFTVTFEDGESKSVTADIKDNLEAIATIAPIKDKGTYGVDWCTMDEDFSNIKTFQKTDVSKISYVLDATTGRFKTGASIEEKQALLVKQYETTTYLDKTYPLTWLNLPQGKTATLEVTIWCDKKLSFDKNDYITFNHNAGNFKVSFKGTDNDAIQLNKVKKGKTYTITITALNTIATKEYITLVTNDGVEVGKIEMAANNTVDLAVKIIPVVFKSNAAEERTDATALKTKTLNETTLLETLNTQSLNQMGIKCSINNALEYIVVDLTTNNWANYYDTPKNSFKNWHYGAGATSKPAPSVNEDGKKSYTARSTEKFVLDKLEEAYYAKYGKTHKGALVFVTDKDFTDSNITDIIQGYSQTDPLRSQGTIIFNSGITNAKVIAHELGHMLGLEHTFFKDATEAADTNDTIDSLALRKNISEGQQEIEDAIAYAESYIEDLEKDIIGIKTKDNITNNDKITIRDKEADINEVKKSIQHYKDNLKRLAIKVAGSGIKTIKGSTNNFMDYTTSRVYFYRHQAEIAKKECKEFYN